MKIGIMTDIHNNRRVLEEVLTVFEAEHCEQILCAGDIIGIGPEPEETVQRLMALPNLLAVRGNHETYLLEGMPSVWPNEEGMSPDEMEYHRWEHRRLSPASVSFLKSLPYRTKVCTAGKTIAIMHYCLSEENRCIRYTPNPDGKALSEMFSNVQGDIVVYGHDHAKTILCHQGRWYINCGSLGCPGKERNLARAAILQISESGEISVQQLEIRYKVSEVTGLIQKLQYPAAAEILQFFFGVC